MKRGPFSLSDAVLAKKGQTRIKMPHDGKRSQERGSAKARSLFLAPVDVQRKVERAQEEDRNACRALGVGAGGGGRRKGFSKKKKLLWKK